MNNDYFKFLKFTKKIYKNINWKNKHVLKNIRSVWFEVKDELRYSLTSHFFNKQQMLFRFGFKEKKKSYRLNSINYWKLRGWSEEYAQRKVFEYQSSVIRKGMNNLGCSNSSKKYLKEQGKSDEEINKIMKKRDRFSFSDIDKSEHLKISKKGSFARKRQIEQLKESNPLLLKEQINTTKEFYLVRGYSEEESIKLLKDRQTTFSLEKLLSIYDEKTAMRIWKKRQEKWQQTLNSKSEEEKKKINSRKAVSLKNLQIKYGEKNGKQKYYDIVKNRKTPGSKEAFKFFNRLLSEISFDEEPYWASGFTNNEYFLFDKNSNRFYFYDFVLKNKKIIIEYHGESFHPRKDKLTKDQWNDWKVPFTNESANSKFAFDQRKNNFAKDNGFGIVTVWSSDSFEKSMEKIVKLI